MKHKPLWPTAISSNKKLNLEPMRPDEDYYFKERIAIMCEAGTVSDEAKKEGVKDVLRFRRSANLGPILEGKI